MTDLSTYQNMLYEMMPVMAERHHAAMTWLLEQTERDAAERKAKDDAYLASLSPLERERVLLARHIDAVERRFRSWWEDNVAWRLRPHAPDHDEDW